MSCHVINENLRVDQKEMAHLPDRNNDQPALATGYPQKRIQDSDASSQMYLRRRTTVSFRLDKNQ